MSKTKNLIGKRFGRLEVIGEGISKRHPSGAVSKLWECRCDCGNVVYISTSHLTTGHTKSCGCLRNEGGKEVRDLTGLRFGRLVAIRENGRTRQGQAMWLCQCDCGNTKTIASSSLVNGLTVSCGCYNREKTIKQNHKHGNAHRHKKTKLYEVWCSMIKRCENPNDNGYKYYGGRGIKVCDEWHEYEPFMKWALENGYKEHDRPLDCTIDRIDVDGNYEPSNCRWADWKTQMNNTRRSKNYVKRNRTV